MALNFQAEAIAGHLLQEKKGNYQVFLGKTTSTRTSDNFVSSTFWELSAEYHTLTEKYNGP